MAKIYAPNKQYTGISASVPFANGVGETSIPHLMDWFKKHGYTVVLDATEEQLKLPYNEQEEDEQPQINILPGELETLKKEQLQVLADKLELEYTTKTTKEELVEMIKVAREMEE